MGTTIHGIIGYNLLKDFIVKINYKSKTVHFYNPKRYTYKKCRRCEIIPFDFYRKKPYIDVDIQLDTVGNKTTTVKMLLDTGGSDALWLFEDSKPEIQTPKKFFNDILGEGLSGSIYGNRSRIPKINLGKFEIIEPTVSFLDTTSTVNARKFRQRNGSIGGNILNRFEVWIDYKEKQIMLRKNGSFKTGFNYNMTGLDIVYNGKQLIREQASSVVTDSYNNEVSKNNTISFVTKYHYRFKPSYKIKSVVKNSPADRVGLKANDIIIKINGKPSHSFTLGQITNKLQEKDKRKIRFTIEREGVKMNFQFRLEKRI